jgi:hypothetical protein
VGKPGTQRDVHNLGTTRALQQFTPGTFEADIAKHGARCLTEKGEKFAAVASGLETPATAASSGTVQARPTFACIASTARRTLRGNNSLFDDLSEPAIISKSYKPRSYVSIAAKRFRFRIVVSQTG